MSGYQGPGQTSQNSETTMRDLLAVVFRRKWLILGVFACASVVVGIGQARVKTTWSADATLLLQRQGSRTSVFERSGRVLPWVEVVESEIEVITSAPVMQRARLALAQPSEEFPEGLQMNLGEIRGSLSTGVVGESNVLFVTGTAPDPRTAIALTNAVTNAYVEFHGELHKLPDAGPMISERAASTLESLEASGKARSELLETLGVTEPIGEERALVHHREKLRDSLSDVERKIVRVVVELEDARRFASSGFETVPFIENTGSLQGNALGSSYTELTRGRSELIQLEQKYTADHPRVREAKGKVLSLEEELRAQMDVIVGTREHEQRALESEARALRAQIDEVSAKLAQFPEVVRGIGVLDTEISSLERQYTQLTSEAVTSDIQKSSFADYNVKVLSPALSSYPNSRGDMIRLLLAPILALMGGIGLAFYLENLDHSVTNREDIERHVSIPVLASFPEAHVDRPDEDKGKDSGARAVPFRGRSTSR